MRAYGKPVEMKKWPMKDSPSISPKKFVLFFQEADYMRKALAAKFLLQVPLIEGPRWAKLRLLASTFQWH